MFNLHRQSAHAHVMSSESSAEPCREGRAQTRLKKEQEEVDAAHWDSQPAGRLRPGGRLKGKLSSSPGYSSWQEVTSEGEEVQIQRLEKHTPDQRGRISHMTVNHNIWNRASASGGVLLERERCLQKSLPRRSSICPHPDRDRQRQAEEPRGQGPFYFFGGANGVEIVSKYCESRGWKRIYGKHREDFKLKWCEIKSAANYYNFRQGAQLMYQIPNNKVLTTKIGLLSSLREYERVSTRVKHGRGMRRLPMADFIPTTFRMDVKEEREAFFAQQEGGSSSESQMWICKPTGLNQGRGIFLIKSQEDVTAFRLRLQRAQDGQASRKTSHHQPQARIVQHYIKTPLLLRGKKFDVRSFLLIACTSPYVVFFRHGYVRLTCDLYDPDSSNLTAHLTNQYMQKKSPLYSLLKEDTVWSMESFNTYVNDRFQVAKALPRDWVLGAFAERMQQIMMQCFCAVKSKLDRRLGLFDLIGCDFMVDEDFKVWLLEMNCNPALHTNCRVLKEVIPSTVMEALDLTLEIFNKCRERQTLLPLASQRDFVLLYSETHPPDPALPCRRSKIYTEHNQKSTRKTDRTKCKSGVEDENVSSASIDVSVQGGRRLGLKTSLHPAASTSTAGHQLVQTVRDKSPQPRVTLRTSICTLHHHLKATDDVEGSVAQFKDCTRAIWQLASRGSGAAPVCRQRGGEPTQEEETPDSDSWSYEEKEERRKQVTLSKCDAV